MALGLSNSRLFDRLYAWLHRRVPVSLAPMADGMRNDWVELVIARSMMTGGWGEQK